MLIHACDATQLDDASERDVRRLADELRLSTVVDLRSGCVLLLLYSVLCAMLTACSTEHAMAAQKYLAGHPAASADATPNPHLLDIPGARRVLLSLTGRSWERALLWRLDWVNYL